MCNILLVSNVASYIFLFYSYSVFSLYKGEGTVKLAQCLLKRHSMKVYGGSGGGGVQIFNCGASWT